MRRYLFCGPSLPDARQLAGDDQIEVRPPVAAGDLLRLPLDPGDVVGLVDGYFHQTRAVRHREILGVLSDGVRVLGAASIGALRAAELDTLGMTGIGQIYRDYRAGILEADDEVALTHAEADSGYRCTSVPLVNIRATLAAAERQGLLDERTRCDIIGMLGQLPYPRRSYRGMALVAGKAGMSGAAAEALECYCREHPVDIKREDALALLDAVRTAPAADRRPAKRPSRTVYLHIWQLQAAGSDAGDGNGWVSDLAALRACQVLAQDYPDLYRRVVLARLAEDCARTCGVVNGADPTDVAVAHGVHRGIYPPLSEVTGFEFLAPWLTQEEQRNCGLRERIVKFLVRSYRVAPGIFDDEAAIAAVRAGPAAASARRVVRAARRMNEDARNLNPRFQLESLREQRITDWISDRWGAPADEMELWALDRGLESVTKSVVAARQFYLFARYNPQQAALRVS